MPPRIGDWARSFFLKANFGAVNGSRQPSEAASFYATEFPHRPVSWLWILFAYLHVPLEKLDRSINRLAINLRHMETK